MTMSDFLLVLVLLNFAANVFNLFFCYSVSRMLENFKKECEMNGKN